jgi:hypothetical protein
MGPPRLPQGMQQEIDELRVRSLGDTENLDTQHRQQLIHAESQLAQVLYWTSP